MMHMICYTVPNRKAWFSHSLHSQQVSARWHGGLSRTCARTKTREIARDMMYSVCSCTAV